MNVALDLAGDAGEVVRLIGAVFGPVHVSRADWVGIGLGLADGGMSYEQLAQLAIDVWAPGASHASIVDLLWGNVVGGPTPSAARELYVGLLDTGTFTPASLAVMAAETDITALRIGLADLALQGVAYLT